MSKLRGRRKNVDNKISLGKQGSFSEKPQKFRNIQIFMFKMSSKITRSDFLGLFSSVNNWETLEHFKQSYREEIKTMLLVIKIF